MLLKVLDVLDPLFETRCVLLSRACVDVYKVHCQEDCAVLL